MCLQVFEETAIKVGEVQYELSQPWPVTRGMFGQVMIGCTATAVSARDEDILVDRSELEDARWFGVEEVRRAVGRYYRPVTPTAAVSSSSAAASLVVSTGYIVDPVVVDKLCAAFVHLIPKLKPIFLFYARISDPGNTGRMSYTNFYRLLRDVDALDDSVTTGQVHLQLSMIARDNAVVKAAGGSLDQNDVNNGSNTVRNSSVHAGIATSDQAGLSLDDFFEALVRISELIRRSQTKNSPDTTVVQTYELARAFFYDIVTRRVLPLVGLTFADEEFASMVEEPEVVDMMSFHAPLLRRLFAFYANEQRDLTGTTGGKKGLAYQAFTASDFLTSAGRPVAVFLPELCRFAKDFEVLPTLLSRGDIESIFYSTARRAGTDVGPSGRAGKKLVSGTGGTTGHRRLGVDGSSGGWYSRGLGSSQDRGTGRAVALKALGVLPPRSVSASPKNRRSPKSPAPEIDRVVTGNLASPTTGKRKGGGGTEAATLSHAEREPDTAFLTFPAFAEAIARMAVMAFSKPFLVTQHPTAVDKVRGLLTWLYAAKGLHAIEAEDWSKGRSRAGVRLNRQQLSGEASPLVAEILAQAAQAHSANDSGLGLTLSRAMLRSDGASGPNDSGTNSGGAIPESKHDGSGKYSAVTGRTGRTSVAAFNELLDVAGAHPAALLTARMSSDGGSGPNYDGGTGTGAPRTARSSAAMFLSMTARSSGNANPGATNVSMSSPYLRNLTIDGVADPARQRRSSRAGLTGVANAGNWRGQYDSDDNDVMAVVNAKLKHGDLLSQEAGMVSPEVSESLTARGRRFTGINDILGFRDQVNRFVGTDESTQSQSLSLSQRSASSDNRERSPQPQPPASARPLDIIEESSDESSDGGQDSRGHVERDGRRHSDGSTGNNARPARGNGSNVEPGTPPPPPPRPNTLKAKPTSASGSQAGAAASVSPVAAARSEPTEPPYGREGLGGDAASLAAFDRQLQHDLHHVIENVTDEDLRDEVANLIIASMMTRPHPSDNDNGGDDDDTDDRGATGAGIGSSQHASSEAPERRSALDDLAAADDPDVRAAQQAMQQDSSATGIHTTDSSSAGRRGSRQEADHTGISTTGTGADLADYSGALTRLARTGPTSDDAHGSQVEYGYTTASLKVGHLGSAAPVHEYLRQAADAAAARQNAGERSDDDQQRADVDGNQNDSYSPTNNRLAPSLFHKGEMRHYARIAAARGSRLQSDHMRELRVHAAKPELTDVVHALSSSQDGSTPMQRADAVRAAVTAVGSLAAAERQGVPANTVAYSRLFASTMLSASDSHRHASPMSPPGALPRYLAPEVVDTITFVEQSAMAPRDAARATLHRSELVAALASPTSHSPTRTNRSAAARKGASDDTVAVTAGRVARRRNSVGGVIDAADLQSLQRMKASGEHVTTAAIGGGRRASIGTAPVLPVGETATPTFAMSAQRSSATEIRNVSSQLNASGRQHQHPPPAVWLPGNPLSPAHAGRAGGGAGGFHAPVRSPNNMSQGVGRTGYLDVGTGTLFSKRSLLSVNDEMAKYRTPLSAEVNKSFYRSMRSPTGNSPQLSSPTPGRTTTSGFNVRSSQPQNPYDVGVYSALRRDNRTHGGVTSPVSQSAGRVKGGQRAGDIVKQRSTAEWAAHVASLM
jgi:hypothetical protein